MSTETYGSEGEFVGFVTLQNGGSEYGMANGNVNNEGAKYLLEVLLKYSSLVVYPICAILFGLWTQNAAFNTRLALIEQRASTPVVDKTMVEDIAVLKTRQIDIKNKVDDHDNRLNRTEITLEGHREKSNYDKAYPKVR
jgi:hypothetical protein